MENNQGNSKERNGLYYMEKSSKLGDPFWGTDPKILITLSRLKEFFPSYSMTINEKLNAIARFSIYLCVLLYLYLRTYKVLYVPIITFGISYLIYRFYKPKQKETFTDKYVYDENNNPVLQLPTNNNPFIEVVLKIWTSHVLFSSLYKSRVKKGILLSW